MIDRVERHRYSIGAVLLLLVLASSGFLLWREGRWKPAMDSKVESLQNEINQLKSAKQSAPSATEVSAAELIEQSQAPAAAEPAATSVPAPTTAPKQSSSSGKPALPASPININTASAYELTALPGVGEATAQKIINYRESHGGFKAIEEIKNVKGIGDATFSKMKANISVN